MDKSGKTTLMITLCGWMIVCATMTFFLLPAYYSAPSLSAQVQPALAQTEAPLVMYGRTLFQALAVSPSELLILGDNQVLDLIVLYFWRLLILCCGIGILRKDKSMRIFFLVLVIVTIVLLALDRFLRGGWESASAPLLKNDAITFLVMFIYLAFFKFPPVQKEFR